MTSLDELDQFFGLIPVEFRVVHNRRKFEVFFGRKGSHGSSFSGAVGSTDWPFKVCLNSSGLRMRILCSPLWGWKFITMSPSFGVGVFSPIINIAEVKGSAIKSSPHSPIPPASTGSGRPKPRSTSSVRSETPAISAICIGSPRI